MSEISINIHLALIYAEKNSDKTTSPEELFSIYRDALDKITACNDEHKGKAFSFE